jgi:cobalt/nickel transport system permease protein
MHIEPGVLSQAKIAFAAVAASGLLGACLPRLLKQPALWLRTLLAASFFSLFMQSFHLPVGPSELHFVGAMPIYLAFGFLPTLFGFALGLLAQGLIFEPQDLMHLAVNTLSLALPLIAVHHTLGKRLRQVGVAAVLTLDGLYYAGVTLMVGFWLLLGEALGHGLADWARFAASYLAVVAIEPLVTVAVLALLRPLRATRLGAVCLAPTPAAASPAAGA